MLLACGALLALVVVAAWTLLSLAWPATHEGVAHLERTLAAAYEVRNGTLYPRWYSLADGGKGSAFGNFYSPGAHLLAAFLFVAGVPILSALKVVTVSALAAAAAGTFVWTRRWMSDAGALASAALYLFAPYHFSDLYVRGALAELLALGLLPWLFLALDHAATSGLRGLLFTAFASAGIVLAHNLSALMVLPFAVAYLLWTSWDSARGVRAAIFGIAGAALGAALSAFYWLPALADQQFLMGFPSAVTEGPYSYGSHFISPVQFFDLSWGRGFSVPDRPDGMSFQLGVAQTVLGVAGVLAILVARVSTPFAGMAIAGSLAALFLATGGAGPIYAALPPLQMVQFPWRFLGPASLFLAALGGLATSLVPRAKWVVAAGAIAVLLAQSGAQRQAPALPEAELFSSPRSISRIEEGRLLGKLCVADEYLPRWASPWAIRLGPSGAARPLSSTAAIGHVSTAGARIRFEATSELDTASVVVPWYYFPGWTATIDGVDTPTSPDRLGFVSVSLPRGRHVVEIGFGSTPLRRAAAWISWFAAALAAFLATGLYSAAVRWYRAPTSQRTIAR